MPAKYGTPEFLSLRDEIELVRAELAAEVAGILAGDLTVTGGDVVIATLGEGLRVKEGAGAKSGIATLVAGTVVVTNANVTANSRIQLTSNVDGGAPGFLRVSARVAGTNFTILSSSGTDTSQVAWQIVEPAP